jgi:hypothetical protein
MPGVTAAAIAGRSAQRAQAIIAASAAHTLDCVPAQAHVIRALAAVEALTQFQYRAVRALVLNHLSQIRPDAHVSLRAAVQPLVLVSRAPCGSPFAIRGAAGVVAVTTVGGAALPPNLSPTEHGVSFGGDSTSRTPLVSVIPAGSKPAAAAAAGIVLGASRGHRRGGPSAAGSGVLSPPASSGALTAAPSMSSMPSPTHHRDPTGATTDGENTTANPNMTEGGEGDSDAGSGGAKFARRWAKRLDPRRILQRRREAAAAKAAGDVAADQQSSAALAGGKRPPPLPPTAATRERIRQLTPLLVEAPGSFPATGDNAHAGHEADHESDHDAERAAARRGKEKAPRGGGRRTNGGPATITSPNRASGAVAPAPRVAGGSVRARAAVAVALGKFLKRGRAALRRRQADAAASRMAAAAAAGQPPGDDAMREVLEPVPGGLPAALHDAVEHLIYSRMLVSDSAVRNYCAASASLV